mmetsp:Transcript_4816/g.12907  ORF Transcript_4816/g.12907 Transcript_4816/m.12907 type:complete len:120 (-) Transcript_4816:1480-1839(-)
MRLVQITADNSVSARCSRAAFRAAFFEALLRWSTLRLVPHSPEQLSATANVMTRNLNERVVNATFTSATPQDPMKHFDIALDICSCSCILVAFVVHVLEKHRSFFEAGRSHADVLDVFD